MPTQLHLSRGSQESLTLRCAGQQIAPQPRLRCLSEARSLPISAKLSEIIIFADDGAASRLAVFGDSHLAIEDCGHNLHPAPAPRGTLNVVILAARRPEVNLDYTSESAVVLPGPKSWY